MRMAAVYRLSGSLSILRHPPILRFICLLISCVWHLIASRRHRARRAVHSLFSIPFLLPHHALAPDVNGATLPLSAIRVSSRRDAHPHRVVFLDCFRNPTQQQQTLTPIFRLHHFVPDWLTLSPPIFRLTHHLNYSVQPAHLRRWNPPCLG